MRFEFDQRPMLQGTVYKDVDFLIVYPNANGPDCVEFNLNEHKAKVDPVRPEGAQFAESYRRWKATQEEVVSEGFDLRLFPFMTPAQIKNCREKGHLRTLEAVLSVPDEELRPLLGVDVQGLKLRGVEFLKARQSGEAKIIQDNAALQDNVLILKEQLADSKEECAKLAAQIEVLQAQVLAKQSDKPGKKAA